MKKRTLLILGLAFILIIIGGLGSIFFYHQLDTEKKASEINKKFKYDNSEELILDIKNSASIQLTTSDDEYVHMNKQGLNFGNNQKESATWNVVKKDKKTTVIIDNKVSDKTLKPSFFNFESISDDSIFLKLPENYKKISIKGDKVDLNVDSLSLDKLAVDFKRGSFSSRNLTTQELTVNNKFGDLSIFDSKFEKDIKLVSSTGNINVENTIFKSLQMETKNGDAFTANTKGNLKISNQYGNTSINHTLGLVDIDNKNGDIFFHSNNISHDVTLNTVHGNIQLEIDKNSYNNNKINLKTEYGIVSIFNKNLSSETSFTSDKGKALIKATSKNGDISVNELDKDDTKYEYD